jgi:type IV pilus assembly protein PilA
MKKSKKHTKKHSKRGFSLIELLIVVAIILIIAAIAIPNLLRSRIAANEASAVASVRTLNTAEITYSTTYPNGPDGKTQGGFATLVQLSGTCSTTVLPTSSTACLIDNALASATSASSLKSGYYFGIDNSVVGDYVIGAVPGAVGTTGTRDFCSTPDGVVRAQTAASGDVPVTTDAGCTAFTAL